MPVKFSLIRPLLNTLVITSLLLVTGPKVLASSSAVYTTNPTNASILHTVQGAPPPVGPPAPWAPLRSLSVQTILTSGLIEKVDEAVEEVNAKYEQATSGVRASVSWTLLNVSSPSKRATEYTDRPNQNFVNIAYKVDYRVYDMEKHTSLGWLDVPGERHIRQTINLQMYCNKWHTNQGRLKLLTYSEPPYMIDDQGTLEQIVNIFLLNFLSPYISSRVRSSLSGIQSGYSINGVDFPIECDALGRDIGLPTDLSDDLIVWSYHPSIGPQIPTAYDKISVTLRSVKRLSAHRLDGTILYDEIEAPTVELFGNNDLISIQLPNMLEGQQVDLNGPTMTIDRPADSEQLVMITNVVLLKNGILSVESSYNVFGSNVSFGKGTQRLVVQKSYWSQFNHETGAKPAKWFVDAYEITFQVNLLEDAISRP